MKAHIYNPCPPALGKGALYLGEPTEENKLGDVDPGAEFKAFSTFVRTGKTPTEFYNRVVKPRKAKEEPAKPLIPPSLAKTLAEKAGQKIKDIKNGKDIVL